jgi:hypothetical protein
MDGWMSGWEGGKGWEGEINGWMDGWMIR